MNPGVYSATSPSAPLPVPAANTGLPPQAPGGSAMPRSSSKEALTESGFPTGNSARSDDDIQSTVSKIKEVSPNQRYIRFGEIIGQTGNIKCSFKAFDTRNGIEVAWHVINLSGLDDLEQEEVARSAAFLKDIRNKFVAEYLSIWVDAESRRLHIITTLLESLREFLGKAKVLRWRIVKKWCKQILKGLIYLHGMRPQIVHRSLSCENIYINGGQGGLCIGNTWLAAILSVDAEPIIMSETMAKHSQMIASPAYNAPEIFETRALDSKADIYSLGICMLEIITREEPYAECHGIFSRIARSKMHDIMPNCFYRIQHELAVDFIRLCLKRDPKSRPSAEELLSHQFLIADSQLDDEEVTLGAPIASPEVEVLRAASSADNIIALGQEATEASVPSSCNDAAGPIIDLDSKRRPADTSVSVSNATSSALLSSPGDQQLKLSVAGGSEGGSETVGATEIHDDASKAVAHTPPMTGRGQPHHTHHQGKATTPHSMKLSKELAALNCSEDVRDDKGVQDGRRQAEREDADSNGSGRSSFKATAPVVQAANNQSTAAGSQATPPVATPPIVQLRLTIDKEHTIDGSGREVEFAFAPESDRYEVVAAEMIQELSLTLQVDALARTIEAEVAKVRSQEVESQDSGEAITSPTSSPDRRASESPSQELPTHSAGGAFPSIDISSIRASEVISVSPLREQQIESVVSLSSERPASASSATGLGIPNVDVTQVVSPTQAVLSPEPAAVGAVVEEETSTSVNNFAAQAPLPASIPALTNGALPAPAPYFGPSGDRDFIFGPDGVFKDPLMEQELSRIDKEASRASRAFESRIQKHKAIQASCEQEGVTSRAEHEERMAILEKKMARAADKAEEERGRLQREFEAKVEVMRQAKRSALLLEHARHRMKA